MTESPFKSILADESIQAFFKRIQDETMDVERFCSEAHTVMFHAAKQQRLSDNELTKVRLLSPESVEQLLSSCQAENGLTLLMRHGEQVCHYFDSKCPKIKKIRKMQAKHNEQDTLTKFSAVDALATMFTVAYLLKQTGASLVVESSENPRSLHVAEAMASYLGQSVQTQDCWKCVNYPSDDDFEEFGLDQHISETGALPWEVDAIDNVCGFGTYDRICESTKAAVGALAQPNQVCVVVTHSQQISAIAMQQNLPESQLKNYGFVAIPAQGKATIHSDGVYSSRQNLTHTQEAVDTGICSPSIGRMRQQFSSGMHHS